MPKKFNFRLEPVLKIKEYEVKEAKEALTQTFLKRKEKEQCIEEQELYRKKLLNKDTGKTLASELQTKFSHKQYIDNEIDRLENEKNELLEIESKQRSKLTEIMKEEKILEKLKDKKKWQYLFELHKEETNILDEIGTSIYQKQKPKEKIL